MRHASRALGLAGLLALAAACAPPKPTTTDVAPRSDRNVLTAEQIQSQTFQNAYEVVEALRTNWLRPRGTDSFQSPSVVIVYLDNVKLGGVETLRGLQLSNIQSIRHYDASSANARWGLGHASGAIQVLTVGGGANPPPDAAP